MDCIKESMQTPTTSASEGQEQHITFLSPRGKRCSSIRTIVVVGAEEIHGTASVHALLKQERRMCSRALHCLACALSRRPWKLLEVPPNIVTGCPSGRSALSIRSYTRPRPGRESHYRQRLATVVLRKHFREVEWLWWKSKVISWFA